MWPAIFELWCCSAICHCRSRIFGTYILSQKYQRPSTCLHSSAQSNLPCNFAKLVMAWATASSVTPSQIPCYISHAMSHSAPLKVTPWRAQITKNAGCRRVRLRLSSIPVPWSACRDSASHLPIVWPGQWCIMKLNWDRYRDHCACHWLSFFTVMKYSRFLWSVQISNLCCNPSRKWRHSSKAQIIASISLSCIS